jgi:hypothetical protein
MQTFLPLPDFAASVETLDNQRLGKQRVETLQVAKSLTIPTYGWKNHPAVKMWVGYNDALMLYQIATCQEWTRRGFQDTCLEKTIAILGSDIKNIMLPPWFDVDAFHASHRSNLLRKDPVWYSQFHWEDPHDMEYWWPTKMMTGVS